MPPTPGAAPPVRRRACVGLGVLVAVGLFAGGIELARRTAGWFRPATSAPFRVVVPAADAVIRRGDPVTLSAYLDPTAPDATLPAVIELVTRSGPGEPEARRRMTPDPGTGAVVAVLPPAAADFEYRVEAGPAASDWFTVRIADPVELAPGTAVELAPPAYAAAVVQQRTVPGFPDLDAVAGSTATFRLRFTRPAATAVLEWRPDSPGGLPETLPVALDPDATGGTATLPIREPGDLRLVLTNEPGPRKLRTEAAARVRVRPDEPPRFVAVSGLFDARRSVHPGQVVTITVALADDVGVASAELEVAAGPGFATVTRLPVTLTDAGTPAADGKVTFNPTALAGVAGDGKGAGIFRLRLRAADGRPGTVPATYPPDRWAEWWVTRTAPPPDAQEAFGPRDAVGAKLAAGQAGARAAAAALPLLPPGIGAKGGLPVDHAAQLVDARGKLKAAETAFREAAREAALTPGQRPLAGPIQTLADTAVAEADHFIRSAATDDPADRKAALEAALVRLHQVRVRVESLGAAVNVSARARLDADRLAALAAAYTALADRAAGTPAAEVTADRGRLAARLTEVLADSELLRNAVAAAAGVERRDLADRAAALAAAVHDLDAVADRLAADARAAVGADLATGQTVVADRAAAVLGTLGMPARLGRVTLPDPAAARAAGGLLADDRRSDGLTELEKFAQALDRAADAFDQQPANAADGKAVAQLLARWQDDLRDRAAGFATLPAAGKAALRTEQQALRATAGRMNLPPDSKLAPLREAIAVHLDMAIRRLDGDGADTERPMRLAVESLTKLADQTPSAADRLARSRVELGRLGDEHKSAAVAAELLLRPVEKSAPDEPVRRKLAGSAGPVADRYDVLADRLAALDLPGLEARRAAAAATAKSAAADLRDGLPLDAGAAVAAARRAIDRLRNAADGQPPADAQAADLARLQADVAARPADHAMTQARIATRLAALAAPEAPVVLHDAHEAARRAETAFKDGKDLAHRTAVAAEALAALADRLTGRRADADRITAFAAARFRAATVARAKAGQPRSVESSEEEKRLGREVEELRSIRVGPAGQMPKRRVLDLYARLLSRTEPDRNAADQAQLAEALAELAAAAAGVADVTRPEPPAEPDPAAGYLPSPRLASPLWELAREQRGLRDRAAAAEAAVAARLRPADGAAFENVERRQRE
ncbi:MAG TPA: hypothetical protein VH092_31605, partial [Urbifossiella sp.]|nr:hypothetical protein [Urbifossiella sp.]